MVSFRRLERNSLHKSCPRCDSRTGNGKLCPVGMPAASLPGILSQHPARCKNMGSSLCRRFRVAPLLADIHVSFGTSRFEDFRAGNAGWVVLAVSARFFGDDATVAARRGWTMTAGGEAGWGSQVYNNRELLRKCCFCHCKDGNGSVREGKGFPPGKRGTAYARPPHEGFQGL